MGFTYIQTDPKYKRGIMLEEYNGTISITTGNEDDRGKYWKSWVFPQTRDREPGPKAIPLKIKLGDTYQEAIGVLKQLMADLGADSSDTGIYPQENKSSQPPF